MISIYRYKLVKLEELNLNNANGFWLDYTSKLGHEIVSIGIKDGDLCVWCEVNPGNMDQVGQIRCYSTGQALDHDPTNLKFFDTVTFWRGARQLFLHIYIPRSN